jgi:hypothetical protein
MRTVPIFESFNSLPTTQNPREAIEAGGATKSRKSWFFAGSASPEKGFERLTKPADNIL